jgi:hypothetical protein
MPAAPEPVPPEESASLDRIPALQIGDSFGLASLLAGTQFEVKSAATPEQLAHDHKIAQMKLEHEQRLDLLKEAQRQRVESRHWYATVAFMALLVIVCGFVAVLGPDPEIRKMAMAGLLGLFATFAGLVVYGAGKAKGAKGD